MAEELDAEAVLQLLQIVDKGDLALFAVRTDGFEMVLARDADALARFEARSTAPADRRSSPAPPAGQAGRAGGAPGEAAGKAAASGNPQAAEAAAVAAPAPAEAVPSAAPALADAVPSEAEQLDGLAVRSPILGTFYRAPDPGSPPYVEIGSHVDADATVGLIEAMKVFTAVQAGRAGTVTRILAENGQFVEFDQPLLVVTPE